MIVWLWIFACAARLGLPEDGQTAKMTLQTALEERVPEQVGRAARHAARWQGQDPELDRMLGDALANVLMKSDKGLDLLRANPDNEGAQWREAVLSAAVRSGDPAVLRAVQEEVGAPGPTPNPTLMEQLAVRARKDPTISWSQLSPAIDACAILDRRPTRGRQALDLPAPSNLAAAARALGATTIIVGRPPSSADPDPLSGRGDPRCNRLVLLPDAELPSRIARTAVIAAQAPDGTLFLEARETNGSPWLIAASDAQAGARWFRAASILSSGGSPSDVQAELGVGLTPSASAPR
jgi:hypothetical protein